MDQNACAECGFSTGDLAEFTRHVERHENGNGQQKIGKERRKNERKNCQQMEMMETEAEQEDDNANESDEIEHNLDEENAENSAEVLGLADLSRFLSAAADSNCQTEAVGEEEEDQGEEEEESPNSGASLSPMSMSTNNHYSATEDIPDGQEDTAKIKQQKSKSCPSTSAGGGHHHKKGRGGGNGGGGGGKTTHRCPHCTFTTFMSQHMKSHLRAHENFVGQMYICDVCGMAFSQKANMHRHRGTHSGVKPYECRFCQKRFFRKDQMQEHSMTHIKTGDDFDCPVSGCDQTFSQHSLLRQHLDHKHQIASTLQAKCKRCTLQFSNSRRLLLHYQTKHDEYYCRVSPVPEGQSPVKRMNGQLKGAESSQNSPVDPDTLSTKRRSRKRPRPSNSSTNESSTAKTSKQLSTSSSTTICNYNVDELLKLECNGGHSSVSASVSPAIFDQIGGQQQNSATATPLFVEPSPSQCSNSPVATVGSGFDLFREHFFRTCSSAALFSNSGAFLGGSTASKEQNNNQNAAAAAAMASAAAAQLFMQSLMFQHHQPPQIMASNPITTIKTDERHSTTPEGSSGKNYLPMAKSPPDCRGLILNGLKSSQNIPSKMEKKEPIMEEKPMNLCSTRKVNNGINDEGNGDASESEEHLSSMELDKTNEEGGIKNSHMPNVEIELKLANSKSSNRKIPGKETKKQASQSQQNPSTVNHPSGQNSTTHSPSSSSTASSSVDVGGGSATSSNDSPLKVLNGLSAGSSAGLLSRVMASSEGLLKEALDQNGDMDCTHCGLVFSDQTLYLLHKGLHSEADPWRCNLCGQRCNDKYTFTTHIVSSDHS